MHTPTKLLELAKDMGVYLRRMYPNISVPKYHIEYDRTLFPNMRDCAYTDGRTITLSDKMLLLPIENQIALLAHELSHFHLLQEGINHNERQADKNAEKIFGIKIFYDDDDIQTTLPGKRPRPKNLPK